MVKLCWRDDFFGSPSKHQNRYIIPDIQVVPPRVCHQNSTSDSVQLMRPGRVDCHFGRGWALASALGSATGCSTSAIGNSKGSNRASKLNACNVARFWIQIHSNHHEDILMRCRQVFNPDTFNHRANILMSCRETQEIIDPVSSSLLWYLSPAPNALPSRGHGSSVTQAMIEWRMAPAANGRMRNENSYMLYGYSWPSNLLGWRWEDNLRCNFWFCIVGSSYGNRRNDICTLNWMVCINFK